MLKYLKNIQIQGTNLEIFRFAFCVSFPIATMIWVGIDTHEKLNIPNFRPDPARLNQIPKDPLEIRAEVERMRAARIERRKRLEEKARRLNIAPPTEHQDNKAEDEQEELSNVASAVVAATAPAPSS
jgi:protein PET100